MLPACIEDDPEHSIQSKLLINKIYGELDTYKLTTRTMQAEAMSTIEAAVEKCESLRESLIKQQQQKTAAGREPKAVARGVHQT